jgi:hypothetical protein
MGEKLAKTHQTDSLLITSISNIKNIPKNISDVINEIIFFII